MVAMSYSDRGKLAMSNRWGGRGSSVQIRVDPDAAKMLSEIPESDRRSLASQAIKKSAFAYLRRHKKNARIKPKERKG